MSNLPELKILDTAASVQTEQDDDEKFLASLPNEESRYIEIRLSGVVLNDQEMAKVLGVSARRFNLIKGKQNIQAFIARRIRQSYEDYLTSNAREAAELSAMATEELKRRFREASVNPVTAEDLMNNGRTHQEARLIMEPRVEGMKIKELGEIVKDMNLIVKRAQEEEREEVGETPEVMNDISDRYNKYKNQMLNINVSMFSTEQTSSFEKIEGRDAMPKQNNLIEEEGYDGQE